MRTSIRHLPEWAPQQFTLLCWPHEHSDWAPDLSLIEPTYIALTAAISRFQAVTILCYDQTHQTHVTSLLVHLTANYPIKTVIVPTNDTWIRDFGPISVHQDHQLQLLDFIFNAWGDKYDANLDNQANQKLAATTQFGDTVLIPQDFVLEGGGIDSDGQGTLLTTRACMYNPSRNPNYSETEVQQMLHRCMGIQSVHCLDNGYLAGDDTDSHVDMLARFCNPETIVYTSCADSHDEHYEALSAMETEIKQLRQASGSPYQHYPLPIPKAITDDTGRRLPASYANFLIINGAVICPIYDDPADKIAVETLQQVFPDREVVPVNATALIHQNGSIHCATMSVFS